MSEFRSIVPRAGLALTAIALLALGGCGKRDVQAGTTYYERKIAPVLLTQCATSPTGSSCHVSADDRGNALGNLDVSSYDMLAKRRDLLTPYGPYGMPALLLKAVPPFQIAVTHYDGTTDTVTTDVPHAGGSLLEEGTVGFTTLQRWIERGATENNAVAKSPVTTKEACVDRIGKDPMFDPNQDPAAQDYQQFVDTVNPFLVENCAGANCHGAPEGAMPLSCGLTPEQVRWNYFSASDYVAKDPNQSELLRRALNPSFGGTYHEGGWFFSSPDDANYQAVATWAKAKGGPTNVPTEPGFEFFAKRVQPMLAKKGCLQLGCHSTPAFPGFKPRGSSNGYFSLPTTRTNYHQAIKQIALETPDPNSSRLLAKNLALPPGGRGIRHRGGSLLAFGGDPTTCDATATETGPLDQADPYCVIAAWIAKERADRMQGIVPFSGIVYVRRPPVAGRDWVQDFEDYAPGADLRFAAATLDAQGNVVLGGSDVSLLAGCGLTVGSADVRRPQVSWDGTKLAFAARNGASEPLRVYVANADGSNCVVDPVVDAPPVDDAGSPLPLNGALVHNFDPAFAPDGTLVFASTRGNTKNTKAFDYQGPQRSPADPAKLNANLYAVDGGKVRQLTFLLNQELQPSFKFNGQLLFTTEKRVPGFYQLAARRINLDGGDYHPLIGQRGSVGYDQVTDIIHLANENFAAIFSQRGAAHQAGALVVINRSLGPDLVSQDPADYFQDPGAIGWVNPSFFQRSLTFLDPQASGRVGENVQGAYRNPSVMPDSRVLVSYAANVVDLKTFSGNFDVVLVDTVTGARTPLAGLSDPTADELWPVAVFGRYSRGVFRSTPADPTGSAVIYTKDDEQPRTDRARLTYLDLPLISSLMFQNTRTGRIFDDMPHAEIWESLPPAGETSLNDESVYVTEDDWGRVYARRRLIGNAPLLEDGSARLDLPGGVPVVLGVLARLDGESSPVWHQQREETQYYPGEWVTLSFRRELYDGFCAGCHGSISGKDTDIAVKPDILTKASAALSKKADAHDLVSATRGDPVAPPYP